MNAGFRLSRWFANEYGSTQCRKITGCDFADANGVSDYVDRGGVDRCRAIGCRVAEQVKLMIGEAASPAAAAP
jgi:hypothetical protein